MAAGTPDTTRLSIVTAWRTSCLSDPVLPEALPPTHTAPNLEKAGEGAGGMAQWLGGNDIEEAKRCAGELRGGFRSNQSLLDAPIIQQ